MNGKATGGIIGIIAVIAILVLTFKFTPSIFKVLLIIGIIIIVALVALIVVGIIFALKSGSDAAKEKKGAEAPINNEDAAVLAKGRENLMNLRRLIMGIRNPEVHSKGNDICTVIDKILQTLRQKPEKISTVRQFFNYYLPTLGEVLNKYERIEKSGVPSEDMTVKVKNYLNNVQRAMDRQYENLFDDDMLDMSVKMEAMTMAVKRDGLLEEDSVKIKDGENYINLTL